MSSSNSSPLLGYLRALLFALWGVAPEADPPPRVLIER
jgi:hypothetical protein